MTEMKRILVGSDFHFPRHSPEAVEAFLPREPVDFIVLNGDVFQDASADALMDFVVLINKCRRHCTSIFVVVGNHDKEMIETQDFKDFAARGEFILCPDGITIGPYRFIHGEHHEGWYTEKYLAEAEKANGVVVVGHAHRYQGLTSSRGGVFGLPCLSKNGVPDARLGFGIFEFDPDTLNRMMSFVDLWGVGMEG